MRNQFRALSVEPVEDRSLPSTLLFIEPGFSNRSVGAAHEVASSAQLSRGWEQARPFQAEAFADAFIQVQFSNNTILFIRDTPTGFQLIPVTVTISTPVTTPQGPTGDGSSGQSGGDSGIVGTGSGPVASPHGPARTGATSSPVSDAADVAVAQPTESASATPAATAGQAAANAAAQVLAQNNQPVVLQAPPAVTEHAAYAFTAVVPESDDGADVVPPNKSTPMPDPGPVPAPAPDTDVGVESGIIQVAAAAVAPVAGVVPVDLSALSAGANQFLGRVADLAPAWPDAMPGFNDTLWVAAAALLTGGGVYAAGARSATKPTRDAVAGALSEWERRNGRVTG